MTRSSHKGQSVIEYSVLVIIVIAVFITMSSYIKRGLAGRWKSTVDELGDQYDPRASSTNVYQSIYSNTDTSIRAEPAPDGTWTSRKDITNSLESKSGWTATGNY